MSRSLPCRAYTLLKIINEKERTSHGLGLFFFGESENENLVLVVAFVDCSRQLEIMAFCYFLLAHLQLVSRK